MIDNFKGKYRFLSNFHPFLMKYDGIVYYNSEAAFQAQKTLDLKKREEFSTLSPAQAKALGRTVKLRPDWEKVKDGIMENICRVKFSDDDRMKNLLLSTGDEELVEGNFHGDKYWGVCEGVGLNKLGLIIMKIREELKN